MERFRRDWSNDWRHRLSDRKSINLLRIETSMKIAILLTSTVRPQVIGSNFSVSERMEMYRSTLQYYAKTIGREYPIVMVENSDVDLTPWKEEFKDSLRLEILQFTPPIYRTHKPQRTQKTMGLTTQRERDIMSI